MNSRAGAAASGMMTDPHAEASSATSFEILKAQSMRMNPAKRRGSGQADGFSSPQAQAEFENFAQ